MHEGQHEQKDDPAGAAPDHGVYKPNRWVILPEQSGQFGNDKGDRKYWTYCGRPPGASREQ